MVRYLSETKLRQFETIIGYEFQDKAWLVQALTHSSFSKELAQQAGQTVSNYERLEFLGDAVLELCTSEMLFRAYPDWPEGKLTKTRATIVCEASLSYIARTLSFGEFILFSRGEEKTGGADRSSILCDVVEAVIGAVYQDGGLEKAKQVIARRVWEHWRKVPQENQTDYKSTLQEILQKKGLGSPEYRMVEMTGPPHDRTFTMEIWLESKQICRASGKTKKAAAQMAAEQALKWLKQENLWN